VLDVKNTPSRFYIDTALIFFCGLVSECSNSLSQMCVVYRQGLSCLAPAGYITNPPSWHHQVCIFDMGQTPP
jgi:hypothetical protein